MFGYMRTPFFSAADRVRRMAPGYKHTPPNLPKNPGVFCKKKHHFPQERVLNHEKGMVQQNKNCLLWLPSYPRVDDVITSHVQLCMNVRYAHIRP